MLYKNRATSQQNLSSGIGKKAAKTFNLFRNVHELGAELPKILSKMEQGTLSYMRGAYEAVCRLRWKLL
jgi:hypothetical protein